MHSHIAFGSVLSLLVFLSACGTKPAPKVPDKITQIEQYTSTIRGNKEVVDPVHGKEIGFLYGAVAGVNGTNANGVAFLRTYENGVSVVTVNLNILTAPSGQRYEGHLSGGAEKSIDMGELRSIIGDVRHSLQFEAKESLSERDTILVKLGGKTIAEGVVKVPSAPVK